MKAGAPPLATPMRMHVQGGPWLTITSLVLGGREVLVDAAELPEPYRVHGARAGITFLHPWANRLSSDDGLPPGVDRDPGGVPIHGLRGSWRVDGEEAVGHFGWPSPHAVRVRLTRAADVVEVVTELRADAPVPVAFGWHPYLRPQGPRAAWELALPERTALALDGRGLPTGGRERLPAEVAPLGDRTFDDAFDEAGAVWRIGDLEVELVEGFGAFQVFAPGDADVVSLEPMAVPVDGWAAAPRATAARAVWRLRLA